MTANGKADRAWADAMGLDVDEFRRRFKPWAIRAKVKSPAPTGRRVINGKVSKNKRMRVIGRDGLRCRYCGAEVELGVRGLRALTIDHVMPLSRGGTNDIANLVVACWGCNQEKAHQLAEEWQTPLPQSFVELPKALPTAACPDCTDGVWLDEDDGRTCPTCEGQGFVSVGRALWLLIESRRRVRGLTADRDRARAELHALRRLIADTEGTLVMRRDLAAVVERQKKTIRAMGDRILTLKIELAEARGDELDRLIPFKRERERALQLVKDAQSEVDPHHIVEAK